MPDHNLKEKLAGMTREERYFYVYELAKEHGDPFPEVVASQFALESAYGTSRIFNGTNNPFGQTTKEKNDFPVRDTKPQLYFKQYDTVEDAIKERSTGKWAKMYANAKSPIEAMAMIQPTYAPNDHGNQNYMRSIADIMKKNGFYNGSVNLPNADVDPNFYQNATYNKEQKTFDFTDEYKENAYNDYISKRNEILKEENPKLRDIKMKRLNKSEFEKGHITKTGGFLNDMLQQKYEDQKDLVDIFKDGKFEVITDDVPGQTMDKDTVYKLRFKGDKNHPELSRRKWEKLKEKYPKMFKYAVIGKTDMFIKSGPNVSAGKSNAAEDFIKNYNQINSEIFGEAFKPVRIQKHGNMPYGIGFAIQDALTESYVSSGKAHGGTLSENAKPTKIEVDPEWKRDDWNPPEPPEATEGTGDSETTDTTQTTETDAVAEGTQAQSEGNAIEEFLNNQIALNGLDGQQFNYKPGKRGINIDAISGLALGMIGMNEAKNTKMPLRTEEIDQAMKNYMAEIKKNSELGLPAEVEAAMKNQLADAYQAGLENLKNASAGNRATVLGNLGSLESMKAKGLIDIAVADYEAKDRAFQQYGKALEYVNDFNARREIANHEIKYRDAFTKREEAKALGAAGFAKLMDALRYDKENGPGSVNDMYRSLLMQQIYGFDPKMPDDGTGKTPGTKSAYEAGKLATQNLANQAESILGKYNTLNPTQKEAVNKVFGEVKDAKQIGTFIDYVKENPNMDYEAMNLENLDIATQNNDWGALSKARESVSTTNSDAVTLGEQKKSSGAWGNPDVLNSIFKDTQFKPTADPGFKLTDEQLSGMGGNNLEDNNFGTDVLNNIFQQ